MRAGARGGDQLVRDAECGHKSSLISKMYGNRNRREIVGAKRRVYVYNVCRHKRKRINAVFPFIRRCFRVRSRAINNFAVNVRSLSLSLSD